MTKPKTTTDGEPPAEGHWDASAPKPLRKDGQHEAHWVLPPEEIAKGYVRPLRTSYLHLACGAVTKCPTTVSETYAREPGYYGKTFCCACKDYFPVGSKASGGEFVWDGTSDYVGT